MSHPVQYTPRSCDLLGLVRPDDAGAPETGDLGTDTQQPAVVVAPFLVWMVDDRNTAVVRAATTLPGAVEAARAYCDAWGADVRYIEDPVGDIVPRSQWELLCAGTAPLPYVYTVELRSPRSTGRDELVTSLWTSTDLDEALRWRNLLPASVRARTLVVSNAPDGHYPNRKHHTNASPAAVPPDERTTG